MGSSQQHILLFMAMAFAVAVTPALSVLGWDGGYLPDTRKCWAEINKTDGCEHELYASVVNKKIDLGFECCEAIRGLDQKCKNWIFNRGRFTPVFGNQVKRFCATLGVTLPPSYLVYFPDHDTPGHDRASEIVDSADGAVAANVDEVGKHRSELSSISNVQCPDVQVPPVVLENHVG
ncbi:hypothetical protein V6N13_026256 [Hibiscus sabdariffa]